MSQTAKEPSDIGQAAVGYLTGLGGVEKDPFPEPWSWIHRDRGGEGNPVAMARSIGSDGELTAISFFETDSRGNPAEPSEGIGGVAVLHDGIRPARAFVFDDIDEFDAAASDTDLALLLDI